MLKAIISGVAILNIYRFYCYYLARDKEKSRRGWWMFISFVGSIAILWVALKGQIPQEITGGVVVRFFVNKIWIPFEDIIFDRYWFWWFLTGIAGVTTIETLFKKRLTGEEAIHGPQVQRGSVKRKDGIGVGKWKRDVLPKHVRKFVPDAGGEEIIIPYNRLSRGVTILGDMGCGKSRLMSLIVQEIISQYPEIPILIHDPKGEWLRTFYDDRKDLIFAPFDNRSAAWSIWNDFLQYPELVHSVISTAVESHHSGAGHDRFWTDSAVTLLEDISGEDSIHSAKINLRKLYKKNSDNKTWASIYMTAIIGFRDIVNVELMNQREGVESRSIDEFLCHPGKIFLLNNPSIASEQHGALTLLLSAFMIRALAGRDVKDEKELRCVVVMDEALTFNLPQDVERAVFTMSRSKGLAVIAGAQRLPKHGWGERGEWADHPSFLFGMRTNDLETRQALTKRLGQIRYEDKQKSTSIGDKSKSETESMQEKHHDLMAPEDWALENREFILFGESGFAPGRVKDVQMPQRDDIPMIDYNPRRDVAKFMNIEG